jgi:hypothetical protein
VANQITSERSTGSVSLRLSNTLTSVLLDVLVLAGADRAKTPWEKKLVYWLVCHDQSRIGLGVVGFDIAQMGWTRDDFAAERQFVLDLIDAARGRHGWERLPFTPREEGLFGALGHLRELVSAFPIEAVGPVGDNAWVPDELPVNGSCGVHRVFLHESGCILCNDVPLDAAPEAAPHRTP